MKKIKNLLNLVQKLKLKKEKLNDQIKILNEENDYIIKENIKLESKIAQMEKTLSILREYNAHLTITKIKGLLISLLPIILGIISTLIIKIGGFNIIENGKNINNLIYFAINMFSLTTFFPFFCVLGFKDYYDYKT